MKSIRAYAKLNLALRVVGSERGYHLLDGIAATVTLADEIELLDADCASRVEWRAGAVPVGDIPAENHCLDAIRELARVAGRRGAAVRVTRNIPDRGGFGGSSAQAAGVLRLLCAAWDIDPDSASVLRIADAVGSDVRLLLKRGVARMRGRGEIVERTSLRPRGALVVAASGGAATAEVFRLYDGLQSRSDADPDRLLAALAAGRFEGIGNDLTEAAMSAEPRIRDVLRDFAATAPKAFGMTGSGAGCFGVYADEDRARAAAARIRAEFVAVCGFACDD